MKRVHPVHAALLALFTLAACQPDDGADSDYDDDAETTDEVEFTDPTPRCVLPEAEELPLASDEPCAALDDVPMIELGIGDWPALIDPDHEYVPYREFTVDCEVANITGETTLAISLVCDDAGVDRVVTLLVERASQRFPVCEREAVTLHYHSESTSGPWSTRINTFRLARRDDDATLVFSLRDYQGGWDPPAPLGYAIVDVGCALDDCADRRRDGVQFTGERDAWTVHEGTSRRLEGSPYAAYVTEASSPGDCVYDAFAEMSFQVVRVAP
ncbi:MAG: hypothetical protein KC468_22300 [Myxococcales bacterium]|nr:hypothetical protein [Myxococcales bacterium]